MTRVPIPIKTPDHRIVGYLSDFDQFEAQSFSRKIDPFKIVQASLHQCLHHFSQWLSRDLNAPRIQIVSNDQFAPPSWQVFDPRSRRTFTFATEADVRNWLEQRYYQ